jgi:hypothetical protein
LICQWTLVGETITVGRNEMKRYLLFVLFFLIAHVLTYLVVGALAYQFLTKQFYQGEVPAFIFMRTESEPELWAHAMKWMIPGQLIRGITMGLALLPFMAVLVRSSVLKRGLMISLIYFVFSHLSAAGPTTSNIEGFIYFRPEYFTTRIFLLTQPEIVVQSLALGLLFALFTNIKGIRRNLEERK